MGLLMRAAIRVVWDLPDATFIEDAGDHRRQPTITNDVEAVVAYVHRTYGLCGRKLFYRDSEGQIDEIRHDGRGNFVGFAPLTEALKGPSCR